MVNFELQTHPKVLKILSGQMMGSEKNMTDDLIRLESHFEFGENWSKFLKNNLNQTRIDEAKKSLSKFLGLQRLDGKRFIDVGCGSGLFSLAAFDLGAEVTSFDLDPASVACCRYLRSLRGNPPSWNVMEGSALNEDLIRSMAPADIVYSWGVLHHTGDMWKAIENTSTMVARDGFFFIAIYNKVERGLSKSRYWAWEKKLYTRSPWILRKFLMGFFAMALFLKYIFQGKNPIKEVRNYVSHRGMNWLRDLEDWIGGYPFEYASVDEIVDFVTTLGFECRNVKADPAHGCSEYLFVQVADQKQPFPPAPAAVD